MKCPSSIDIFCSVVDNFGDIGVCWRLSRQMACEHRLKTRLFVDDMSAFRAIVPEPNSSVEVVEWRENLFYAEAADIVIEAFACDLPDHVVAAMVIHQSVWIDLEYLSAEEWTAGCHAIPSLHPSTGLKKTLFFPGFDTRTGGLICENDLISRRNAFLNDKNAQNQWRMDHFIPEIGENCLDISLFCYHTAPIDEFFAALATLNRRVRVFQFSRMDKVPVVTNGLLEIYNIPFVSQYDFDYALWTMDMNFVRGEDSFVRAQFAGKPFVWNIYVQDEDVHLDKLDAFLSTIKPFYDGEAFERLANLHDLWNEGARNKAKDQKEHKGHAWQECLQSLDGFGLGARKWAEYLVQQTDLATRLLTFARTQITENKGRIE